MPSGQEILPPDEANFCRHTLCMSRKFNEVWREKIRSGGILSVVNTGSYFATAQILEDALDAHFAVYRQPNEKLVSLSTFKCEN